MINLKWWDASGTRVHHGRVNKSKDWLKRIAEWKTQGWICHDLHYNNVSHDRFTPAFFTQLSFSTSLLTCWLCRGALWCHWHPTTSSGVVAAQHNTHCVFNRPTQEVKRENYLRVQCFCIVSLSRKPGRHWPDHKPRWNAASTTTVISKQSMTKSIINLTKYSISTSVPTVLSQKSTKFQRWARQDWIRTEANFVRCQAKFLTSAKFLTCCCFSVILLLKIEK